MTQANEIQPSAGSMDAESLLLPGANFSAAELGRGKDAVAYAACEGLVYRQGHEMYGKPPAGYIDHIADRAVREVAMYSELDDGVCAARVVMAWIADNRIHKLVERAAGNPLFRQYRSGQLVERDACRRDWETGIARTAAIPQAHFDTLIQTDKALRERSTYIDYMGTENLFYDVRKGFTVIDAEFEPYAPLKGAGLYSALLASNDRFFLIMPGDTTWQKRIAPQSRQDAIRILKKLERAGHEPTYKLLFKLVCEKLEYTPDYTSTDSS